MHAAVTDFMLDLVQNSLEAGAGEVLVGLHERKKRTVLAVKDNGCGMSEAIGKSALDPFFTGPGKHRRRFGLGLPFLQQSCEQAGGRMRLRSKAEHGTCVAAAFAAGNIDHPPLGDVPTAVRAMMTLPGAREIVLRRSRGEKRYEVRRSELEQALGSLEDSGALVLMNEYLRNLEAMLEKG